jgi:hypothetical protein
MIQDRLQDMLQEWIAEKLPASLAGRFRVTLFRSDPVPVFLVRYDGSFDLPSALSTFLEDLLRAHGEAVYGRALSLGFRTVGFDQMEQVLERGCDLNPVDAPMFVAELEEALDIEAADRFVLGFDRDVLRPTFEEVPTTTPPDEIARLKAIYPTYEYALDGETIWFSRLDEKDPRRTTLYEAAYGRYIPSDPWQALKALIVLVHGRDPAPELAAAFDRGAQRR